MPWCRHSSASWSAVRGRTPGRAQRAGCRVQRTPPPALALAECLAGEAEVSLKLTVTRMWNEDEL